MFSSKTKYLFPCLFQLLELHFLAHGPFLYIFKVGSKDLMSLSPLSSYCVLLCAKFPLSPSYKSISISYAVIPGQSIHLKIFNLIPSAKSILLLNAKVTSSRYQVLGIHGKIIQSTTHINEVIKNPEVSAGKESVCNVEDLNSIPGLRRSPEENGYRLQYSGLENPMDVQSMQLQ